MAKKSVKPIVKQPVLPVVVKPGEQEKPKIALIFDDLGENIRDVRNIASLNIPVTVSVIPGLRFSQEAAYAAAGKGFSVLIHLPLAPKREEKFRTNKYQFISSSSSHRKNEFLLRSYLNAIRVAIGVNNHMGSQATENYELMEMVLKEVKLKKLIFIDSHTSPNSVVCAVARKIGLPCMVNDGFVDSVPGEEAITKKIIMLIDKAKQKGKIIIIAHPHKTTIEMLKKQIITWEGQVDFVTIKDYFELD
jgi:hypothetical protein